MKIRVGEVQTEGDCNFCTRNPGQRITIMGGRSLDMCICDRCLAEIKQQSPANRTNFGRKDAFVRNSKAFLPDYTNPEA